MERRVLWGLCQWCPPTSPCLGLCQGVARAALTVGSAGVVLTYGYQMVGVKKKKKRKSPSGGFHQQFMAMTTMPVLPPLLILVHPLNSTHWLCSQVFPSTASLNKTLQ